MRKGFTLIELLIVIAIIGLLSSILLPNISGAQNKAKEAAVKAVMYNLQTELESYQIDNLAYPEGNGLSPGELADLLKLKQTPKNPYTGQNYSKNDQAGRIVYDYDTNAGAYSMTGYKRDGTSELLVLTNI